MGLKALLVFEMLPQDQGKGSFKDLSEFDGPSRKMNVNLT